MTTTNNNNSLSTLYLLSGIYNLNIVLFSKGFRDDLGAVDPFFSPLGCVMIVLWGLAYMAVANVVERVPQLSLVFAVEKVVYGARWILWMQQNYNTTLPQLLTGDDPVTGLFFAIYGTVDIVCCGLFFYSAAKHWNQPSDAKKD